MHTDTTLQIRCICVQETLFDGKRQLLCVYPAVTVLGGYGDDGCTAWQWTDKLPERVSVKKCGCRLAIDHYDCSGFGEPFNLQDVAMWDNARDAKIRHTG